MAKRRSTKPVGELEEDLDWTPAAICSTFDLGHPDDPEILAKVATEENPANAPSLEYLSAEVQKIMTPARIALITQKWWKATKTRFTVYFMGNPPQAVRDRILMFANVINKHCALEFVETTDASTADFRIADLKEGYYSYLGTDCLSIAKNLPTMVLQGMYGNFSDAEGMRVIPHEFLHGVGAPHEHSRLAIVSRLDPVATKKVFKRDQGWGPQTVEQQVLKVLSESLIFGTPADEFSIMCYWFTGECTKDGRPIVGGKVLSPSDIAFLGRTWVKVSGPVDPTDPVDPTGPPVVGAKLDVQIVDPRDGSVYRGSVPKAA